MIIGSSTELARHLCHELGRTGMGGSVLLLKLGEAFPHHSDKMTRTEIIESSGFKPVSKIKGSKFDYGCEFSYSLALKAYSGMRCSGSVD